MIFTEGIARIIIYPKLKCHPFTAHHCISGGSGDIFSIRVDGLWVSQTGRIELNVNTMEAYRGNAF